MMRMVMRMVTVRLSPFLACKPFDEHLLQGCTLSNRELTTLTKRAPLMVIWTLPMEVKAKWLKWRLELA